MKRLFWKGMRKSVPLLFLLALLCTLASHVIIHSQLAFTVCIFVDIFLCFLCLIRLQIAWQFGRSPHAHRQVQQPAVSSFLSMFPITINRLLRLSPTEFEEFVGIVLEAMGMEYTQVQRIGGSGDHGADLLARNTFQLRVIVQCKLYTPGNQVGSPDLQRFLGSITHYQAIYGWFITTSTFTKPALDFSSVHSGRIRLLDGAQLLALITQRQREISLIWQQRNSRSQGDQ